MRERQVFKASGDENIQVELHQVRFHVGDNQEFLKKLRNLGKENQCTFICFNRNSVVGKRHVEAAIRFAFRSFNSDSPISRSIEVEALLYAAGTRQTGLIGTFGSQAGENECYLCILPPVERGEKGLRDFMEFVDEEDWEGLPQKKIQRLQKLFWITDAEIHVTGIKRICDLVLERVVLLNINR
nr:KEOPS complex subunit Cgi121 [uncultured Methanospirillum sp.]